MWFIEILKNKYYSLCIFVAIIFIAYIKVPFIFFQQDELLGFGEFIALGQNIIFNGASADVIRHFVPVTMSITFFIFKFFGFNYIVYNLLALTIHLLNTFLVYLLGKKIFKHNYSAVIASMLFVSSSVASELVMWPVINVNVISLTFALIIWILLIDKNTLKDINGIFRGLLFSILFLFSVFSVEYSLGLVLFVPFVLFTLNNYKIQEKVKIYFPYFITTSAYLYFRLVPIFMNEGVSLGIENKTPLIIRLIFLVPRYIGQLFLSNEIGLRFSYFLFDDGIFIEKIFYPIFLAFIGLCILSFSLWLHYYSINRKKYFAYNLMYIVVFMVFSALPFLFVPGAANSISIISSRYLYFGLIASSLWISVFIDFFVENKNMYSQFFIYLALTFMIVGIVGNYNRANLLYDRGEIRIKILDKIRSEKPNLEEKTVFFVVSDTAYYGLSTPILPFQSGFGQTLLVYYSQYEDLPISFFPGNYLWEITSQGYKTSDGVGFGYFWNYDSLLDAIKNNEFSVDDVSAFYWQGKLNSLSNSTVEIRKKLVDDLSKYEKEK